MSSYLAVDIWECRRKRHAFQLVGSDKTPLKLSLICLTCSAETGKQAYAAFGEESGSHGQWRRMKREADDRAE